MSNNIFTVGKTTKGKASMKEKSIEELQNDAGKVKSRVISNLKSKCFKGDKIVMLRTRVFSSRLRNQTQ